MQKILKIVLIVIGVLALFFLGRIVMTGDDEIKAMAAAGTSSMFEPLAYIAYFVLAVTVILVLLFVLKGLFSNTATLKNTLISIGAFVLVVIIGYVLATGVETPMQDGEMLSASGSKWVGAGLYTFYILAIVAGGAMLFTGIKKMIR
ncbi:hypothetical protein [Lacinutrix chionoecetis]